MTFKEYLECSAYQYYELYYANVIDYMIFKLKIKFDDMHDVYLYKVVNPKLDFCHSYDKFIEYINNQFDDELNVKNLNISGNISINSWAFAHEKTIKDVINEDGTIEKNVHLPGSSLEDIDKELIENSSYLFSSFIENNDYKDITKNDFMKNVKNGIKQYIAEYKKKYIINNEKDINDETKIENINNKYDNF